MSEAKPARTPPAKTPATSRQRSQKRLRVHQRIGVYDEREAALFDAAYERYRQSRAAAEHGESVAAFLRYMTIGEGARTLPPRRINPDLPPDLVDRLSRVLMELMRQGNNLNQIAHHQNAGRKVLPEYIQVIFTEYRATIRAVQHTLGMEDEQA